MRFLAFLYFIFLPFFGTSQYAPLIRHDVVWQAERVCTQSGELLDYDKWERSISTNDTVVNGHQYFNAGVPTFRDSLEGKQSYWLREDTVAGKVYRLIGSDTSEVILYDWTLQTGDSLYQPAYQMWMHVTLTSTRQIAGRQRRTLELSRSPTASDISEAWIEGIGSNLGPLRTSEDCVFHFPRLLCYYSIEPTDIIYGDCEPLGNEPRAAKLNEVIIYPIPSSEELTVRLPDWLSDKVEVVIFSLDGILVEKHNVESELTLSLSKGVYIVHVPVLRYSRRVVVI